MVCTICGQIVQILIQLTVADCSLLDLQHYQQLIHALVPCLEGHISYSKSVMADPEGEAGGADFRVTNEVSLTILAENTVCTSALSVEGNIFKQV